MRSSSTSSSPITATATTTTTIRRNNQRRNEKKTFLIFLRYLVIVVISYAVIQLIDTRWLTPSSVFDQKTKTKAAATTTTAARSTSTTNNTECSVASSITEQQIIIKSSLQQQQQHEPFNVTGKGLCFIHVGKTGGASFREQFADGRKVIKHGPSSIPQLKLWREFHVEREYWLNREWYRECDYFVAWVRDPIDRAISAYNMIFDPEWVGFVNTTQHHNTYVKLMKVQNGILSTYGNLNNLAENLFLQGNDDDKNNQIQNHARNVFETIDHIQYNTGWFFHSDSTGKALQPPVVATRMYTNNNVSYREISTNKLIVPRLSNPEFRKKLVFVGSTECYSDDVQRFTKMFGINSRYIGTHPIQHVHTSKSGGNFDRHESISTLSEVAIQNIRRYFSTDYDVLSSLIDYNLIQCPKLIQKILCQNKAMNI